jgi:dTDP-4-dehydrorhamnose 3,5-epimerase
MPLSDTPIDGLFVATPEFRTDDRGGFARTWDAGMAAQRGLLERFDYTCISTNRALHTLRGMHWQRLPHGETKLVRCTKGAIYDVIVDLRPGSPTFKKWHGEELTAENHRALYVPPGCAHGFLSLTPEAEVLYHIAGAFVPEAAAGARWDDPAFGIRWPAEPAVIAERDAAYPDFA